MDSPDSTGLNFDRPGLNIDVSTLSKTLNRLIHREEWAANLRLHVAIFPDAVEAKARLAELDREVGILKGDAQALMDSIGERLSHLRDALNLAPVEEVQEVSAG